MGEVRGLFWRPPIVHQVLRVYPLIDGEFGQGHHVQLTSHLADECCRVDLSASFGAQMPQTAAEGLLCVEYPRQIGVAGLDSLSLAAAVPAGLLGRDVRQRRRRHRHGSRRRR